MHILNPFAGGSLCEVVALQDSIIKRYSGNIQRGSDKLRQEYEWLSQVPSWITEKYPLLFPRPLHFSRSAEHNQTELHISRIPRLSLTKAIIGDKLTPDRAAAFLRVALDLLVDTVYGMRADTIPADAGYRHFHSNRIALARKYLRRLPYLDPILGAANIIVNDIVCPSVNQFLTWLDTNHTSIFVSNTVISVHGNFHLDNILVDPELQPKNKVVSFIDPRGDLLGFPHYDLAKLLITLEGYYDELHYGAYELYSEQHGNSFQISIKPEKLLDTHYVECLLASRSWLSQFAEVEHVSITQMLWLIYVVECIHILSFCFYHAYGPEPIPNKIRAFIAMFAIMARRLFNMWTTKDVVDLPNTRLGLE